MSTGKTRKTPQVFVFEDPEKKYMQAEAKPKFSTEKKAAKKSKASVKGFNVRDHYDEILEFSKQALSREERNDYELEKIGAIRHKKKHLNIKEAKKEKEIKKKEERLKKRFEKVNHIVTPVEKKTRKIKQVRDEDKNMLSQPGRYINGVLHVDPKMLGK